MKMPRTLCVAISLGLLLASAQLSRAEKWVLPSGEIEGKLTGVYGTIAHIVGKKTMYLQPLGTLDEMGLDQVARFLAAQPAEKTWAESTSGAAKAIKGKLQVVKDGKPIAFDSGTRPEPEFYVVYFSAHWCGPCRQFTPKLVETYHTLPQRDFGHKLDILFYSYDHSRKEQLAYVTDAGMPWPVIKFDSSIAFIEKWKPRSIPGLVVFNRNGDPVFHSQESSARKVMTDLFALLREMDPGTPQYLKGTHRLAVRQQLLTGASQTLPAKVHYINIDKNRYNGLAITACQVRCIVNEKGLVSDFTPEPELPAAYGPQLRADVEKWLFLPAVENGQARPQEVVVPVSFLK
jgi:thiol-disulfide isomerase/thioredoxin